MTCLTAAFFKLSTVFSTTVDNYMKIKKTFLLTVKRFKEMFSPDVSEEHMFAEKT